MPSRANKKKPAVRRKRSDVKLAHAAEVARGLAEMIPDPKCELDFATPFQLLVATILSAQTTDKGVGDRVTPEQLFRCCYPTPRALAGAPAPPDDVERIGVPDGLLSTEGQEHPRSCEDHCGKRTTVRFPASWRT